MTAVLGRANGDVRECDKTCLQDLEGWGRESARREQTASLLYRIKTMAERPPKSSKPQTVAYVEEGLRILGFEELACLVRVDLNRTLKLFHDQILQRELEQKQALERIREHRKALLFREVADSIEHAID